MCSGSQAANSTAQHFLQRSSGQRGMQLQDPRLGVLSLLLKHHPDPVASVLVCSCLVLARCVTDSPWEPPEGVVALARVFQDCV